MVAAGYCTYGSCSTLVLTTGQGVNGYTLDTEIGEFILTHPDVSAITIFFDCSNQIMPPPLLAR